MVQYRIGIIAHLTYGKGLRFYFRYSIALIKQYGNHSRYNNR